MLYAGIDIGSSSTKGILVDEDLNILHSSKRAHSLSIIDNKSTVNGNSFYNEVLDILKELSKKSKDKKIDKIIFSGFESLTVIDKTGREVFPTMTYLDKRSDIILNRINDFIPEKEIIGKSKNRISSVFEGYKIIYLYLKNREKFKKVWKVLDIQRFIGYKLTGNAGLDKTSAMLFAPFYDVNKDNWNYEFIDEFKLNNEIFPRIMESHESLGFINDIEFLKGTEVIVGAQDAYAQLVSEGITESGETSLIYGTTAVFNHIHDGEKFSEKFVNTKHVNGKYIIEAAMFNTGSLISWYEKTFNTNIEKLNKFLKNKDRPSKMIVIPFFTGERAPFWNNELKGSINNIDINSGPLDIYLSILESVGYWLKYVINVAEQLDYEINDIVTSGGGAHNRYWVQIVSDITNKKQKIVKNGSAEMGDVYIGLFHDKILKDYNEIKKLIDFENIIRPKKSLNKKYEESYKYFINLLSKQFYNY